MTRLARSPRKSKWTNRWLTPSGAGFLSKWAQLYADQTVSESALEPAVAALGRPYRFQHPIFSKHYFVDFALMEDKIIIEVDGRSHNSAAAKEADAVRTAEIEKLGWTLVRCKNEDAQKDPAGTVARCLLDAGIRRLNMFSKVGSNV